MKIELYISSDGAMSIHHNSGEVIQLEVRHAHGAHSMDLEPGHNTFVGKAVNQIIGVGLPRTATRLER